MVWRGSFQQSRTGGFVQGITGDRNRADGAPQGEVATPIFVWNSHSLELTGPTYAVIGNEWTQTGFDSLNVLPGSGYDDVIGLQRWNADIDFLATSVQTHEAADYAAAGRAKPRYKIVFIQQLFRDLLVLTTSDQNGVLVSVTSRSQLTPPTVPFPTRLSGMNVIYTSIDTPMEPHVGGIPGNRIAPFFPSLPEFAVWVDSFLQAFFAAWQASGGPLESHWLPGESPSVPFGPFLLPQVSGSNNTFIPTGAYTVMYDLMAGYLIAAGFPEANIERFREALLQQIGHEQLRIVDGQRVGDLFLPQVQIFGQARWVRAVGVFIRSLLP